MMDKLARLIEKKKLRPLDEDEQAAKADVLEELRGAAKEAMGGRLKGLKQVKVASDSKEGLKAGLQKAEEMLGDEKEPEDKGEESEEQETSEHEEDKSIEQMDEHEIDEKLKELMELKEKLKLKQGL